MTSLFVLPFRVTSLPCLFPALSWFFLFVSFRSCLLSVSHPVTLFLSVYVSPFLSHSATTTTPVTLSLFRFHYFLSFHVTFSFSFPLFTCSSHYLRLLCFTPCSPTSLSLSFDRSLSHNCNSHQISFESYFTVYTKKVYDRHMG